MTSAVLPEAVELLPHSYFAPLVLSEVFPNAARLEVDVGSGPGRFLLAMAQKHPERNFLGLERLLGRVRRSCGAASRLGLQNVRLLRVENYYAVRYLLPPASVAVFHVGFPDPWPKRKHWPRRLVNADFLAAAARALAPGGELRIKTDDAPYFASIGKTVAACPAFREIEWQEDPDYPLTNFERTFRARGQPIHRLRLVAV